MPFKLKKYNNQNRLFMSVFETQGKYVSSAEPLSEWLDAHGIDTRVSAIINANEARQRAAWNKVLACTDAKTADSALQELRTLEHASKRTEVA